MNDYSYRFDRNYLTISIILQPNNSKKPLSSLSLNNLCADVADAVAGPLQQRDQRVANALRPYLGLPDLLDDSLCRCSPDRYMRHLLQAETEYTILALVWRPGQMSPVHAHRTWCALGLHRGWMVETFFAPCRKPTCRDKSATSVIPHPIWS